MGSAPQEHRRAAACQCNRTGEGAMSPVPKSVFEKIARRAKVPQGKKVRMQWRLDVRLGIEIATEKYRARALDFSRIGPPLRKVAQAARSFSASLSVLDEAARIALHNALDDVDDYDYPVATYLPTTKRVRRRNDGVYGRYQMCVVRQITLDEINS